MEPICDGVITPQYPREIIIKDDYLARALEGEEYLLFDGALGTMIQRLELSHEKAPELLAISDPELLIGIHQAYAEAGAQVITANTFGANRLKLPKDISVQEIFSASIDCARAAHPAYVAADIGPTGAFLEPFGTFSFEEAYGVFAEQMLAAKQAEADLIIIETMTDLREMKAAVLAAKELTNLPIFATMTFEEDGRTFLGTTPSIAARTLDALGVSALGLNCSLGPDVMKDAASEMLEVTTLPIIMQANAGLPLVVDGKTVYGIDPQSYCAAVGEAVELGISIVGGCCGTDPTYIALLAEFLAEKRPTLRTSVSTSFFLTSFCQEVVLENRSIGVVGERINPTGKKALVDALKVGDFDYVAAQAIAQQQAGADILDVNVGHPAVQEPEILAKLATQIPAVCPLPLQIDSANVQAIEAAVRVYGGVPLINSVNGTKESLATVLPLAAHYGCAVIGLTLDEEGIPRTAEKRLEIAERIVDAAIKRGISRQLIVIDCLVMTASTNQAEILQILRAVSLIKEKLKVRTILGVSNISFGLPARDVLNATFLACALEAGLNLAIVDPLSQKIQETISSWKVLSGQDVGASDFIERAPRWHTDAGQTRQLANSSDELALEVKTESQNCSSLYDMVLSGLKAPVKEAVLQTLVHQSGLDIINESLIPALDEAGIRFERGSYFLPQLMAAADAAKVAFDLIEEKTEDKTKENSPQSKSPIVLATVKGDIHDIGKNIVAMLLKNYGYQVIDLGRDVAAERIVDSLKESHALLVGLSALMTTTLTSMEETINLIHSELPDVQIFVGGAVLTPEIAQDIGADFYAKDAAASTRIAAKILG